MKTFRPVIEEKSPINLTFGLALQQIVDLVSFIIRVETDLVSFKTMQILGCQFLRSIMCFLLLYYQCNFGTYNKHYTESLNH